jgi:hypothetical protein
LVDSDADNGAYNKNPFHFKNFGVTSVGISVNGEEILFRPLQLSYVEATSRFIQTSDTLFSGTGKMYYNYYVVFLML